MMDLFYNDNRRWGRMYNPYNQYRIDSIDNQIKSLEQQRAMLSQVPVVNNYLNTAPPSNYDFNGIWASSEDEARQVASANLPIIIMNKNDSKFYIKNLDGSFKTYSFSEEAEKPKVDTAKEINDLKMSVAALNDAVQKVLNTKPVIIGETPNMSQTPAKNAKKEQ